MKYLTKLLPTQWHTLRPAKYLLLLFTTIAHNYLYLTEDYKEMDEPIVDWHQWHTFWNSLHLKNSHLIYDAISWEAFKLSADTALFYNIEAVSFLLFAYLLYKMETDSLFKSSWGVYTLFFIVRLFFEIYAALFSLSINAKYINVSLFFVSLIVILFFLINGKRKEQMSEKPKLK